MRRSLVVGLVGLCVAMSAAVVRAEDAAKKAGEYPDVTIQELKGAMEKGKVTVIDVNGTDAYKEGHIPGAIDFEARAENIEKVLPKDKGALIVAYCGGRQCGAYKSAAKKAVALGYTNVKHLSAGISGWKDAGEKVEKGDKAAASAN